MGMKNLLRARQLNSILSKNGIRLRTCLLLGGRNRENLANASQRWKLRSFSSAHSASFSTWFWRSIYWSDYWELIVDCTCGLACPSEWLPILWQSWKWYRIARIKPDVLEYLWDQNDPSATLYLCPNQFHQRTYRGAALIMMWSVRN